MNSVAARIKSARTAKQMSQNDLANKCGWPDMQARISNYENGRTEPSYSDLEKIASVLGVDPAYLAFGAADPERTYPILLREPAARHGFGRKNEWEYLPNQTEAWDGNSSLDHEDVDLPFFTDFELAAGVSSMLANERIGPKRRFSKELLEEAGVPAESVLLVQVHGDPMKPAVPDGAVVGINKADKNIRDGKMYAIEHGGLFRIKYLKKLPHGGLKLQSENNTEYPDEILDAAEAADVVIVGRVFHVSVLY